MSRKSVNIITPFYTPEITAAAHRMEAAAKALSFSYRVNVFTLSESGKCTENYSVKVNEHLAIHYFPRRNYNKSVFLIRAFYETWYSIKLIQGSNKINADLSIVTIPFMFLLPLFASFSRAKKKIADVRDIVWHYLPENNAWLRTIKKMLVKVMHKGLQKFDLVTVTNEAEKRWLINNSGLCFNDIYVIPNGISSEKFNQLANVRLMPHPLKFNITYIGNIGTGQHFISLINAVKEMKDVRLNLIGNGNDFKSLNNYVNSHNITNVFFTGLLKWGRTIPYYQTSNILFASLKENYDTAIPSKLYEYLSTGLPVIFEGGGAAADFLRNYKNTFIVSGKNPSEIESVIWKIKRQGNEKAENNILNIGALFIREKLSQRFVELSARLLNEKVLSDVFIEDLLQNIEH